MLAFVVYVNVARPAVDQKILYNLEVFHKHLMIYCYALELRGSDHSQSRGKRPVQNLQQDLQHDMSIIIRKFATYCPSNYKEASHHSLNLDDNVNSSH